MKKSIILMLCCMCLFAGIYPAYADASDTLEYCRIYGELTDKNYYYTSYQTDGFIMLDFNQDGVPELLSYELIIRKFDESGNEIPTNVITKNIPARTEKSHLINGAFSIVDGNIKYSSFEDVNLPYLPGNANNKDTGLFAGFAKYHEDNAFIVMNPGEDITIIRYIDNEFVLAKEKISDQTNDLVTPLDYPIVYADYFVEVENSRYKSNKNVIAELTDKYIKELASLGINHEGIPSSDWAKDMILRAASHNLIPAKMMDVDFRESVKYEELIALASTLANSLTDYPSSNIATLRPFETNFSGSKYYKEMMYAYKNGFLDYKSTLRKGYDIYIDTEKLCTREDSAFMLSKVLANYPACMEEFESHFNADTAVKFSDDAMISESAKKGIYYLSSKGVISGVDDTHFAPTQYATIEQVITMCERIYSGLSMTKYKRLL